MARAGNPFYYAGDQQLGQQLGASLGRALFGDPEMAAKLALQRAQMANYAAQTDEANAHAGLYGEQTTGQRQKNTGSARLSDLFANMVPPAPVAASAPPVVDPLAPLPDAAPVGPTPDQVRSSIPGLLSAMALARGDTVPVAETLAQLPAYFGDDELARRSMVGQGHTPGKEFAITPQRADDIAQQGYTADFNKDTSVARINHATDIPVEQIRSGDRRYAVNVESGDRRYAADKGYQGTVDSAGIRAGGGRTGGWTPRFRDGGDNADADVDGKELVMSQRLGVPPDQPIDRSRLGEVFAAIAATEGPIQNNNPGNIVDGAFARSQPGYAGRDKRGFAVFNSPEAGRQAGIQLLNAYYNRGQRTIRDIVEGAPLPTKQAAAKAPPKIAAATVKTIANLIDDQAKARGLRLDLRARQNMMTSAAKLFQKNGGNPNAAVDEVYGALQRNIAARQGGTPGDIASERQRAQAAIAKGAPREQVAQLFKERTGQAL